MLHSSNILCSALLKVRNDDSGGLYMYVYIDFGFIVSWLSFSLKYIDLYVGNSIMITEDHLCHGYKQGVKLHANASSKQLAEESPNLPSGGASNPIFMAPGH